MLSKLIVAGLGIAAAGLIAAPIASADSNTLTNADVMQSDNPAPQHQPIRAGSSAIWGGGGGGNPSWMPYVSSATGEQVYGKVLCASEDGNITYIKADPAGPRVYKCTGNCGDGPKFSNHLIN